MTSSAGFVNNAGEKNFSIDIKECETPRNSSFVSPANSIHSPPLLQDVVPSCFSDGSECGSQQSNIKIDSTSCGSTSSRPSLQSESVASNLDDPLPLLTDLEASNVQSHALPRELLRLIYKRLAPADCSSIESLNLETDLYWSCPLGEMTFEHAAGPCEFGVLTVIAAPGNIDADSIAPILDVLKTWARNGALQRSFVAIFDMGAMSLPSIFGLPRMYQLFNEYADEFTAFRKYQQCFAAVRGDSMVFNAFTDAIIKLSKIETVPIFASDRKEAIKLIRRRYGRRNKRHTA